MYWSVVRLTDSLDMTIAVDCEVNPQTKQTNKQNKHYETWSECSYCLQYRLAIVHEQMREQTKFIMNGGKRFKHLYHSITELIMVLLLRFEVRTSLPKTQHFLTRVGNFINRATGFVYGGWKNRLKTKNLLSCKIAKKGECSALLWCFNFMYRTTKKIQTKQYTICSSH